MEIYLVGGAVRDELLGLPVTERDWVVVGATPEMMLGQGYRPVGKDFPVFLHPKTHEEYALARTERKVRKGYTGFKFHAAPDVTLEEDLKRRDLTINAMAKTVEGQIIDPYGGQHDLQHRVLKHVSPAFSEDPVRILRVARLAARFVDFQIHPDTLQLMRSMVTAGEVNALVAERVWQELYRALKAAQPQRFFEVLNDCGALAILFPEIILNEKNVMALQNASLLSENAAVRFAAFLAEVPALEVKKLCARFRVPQEFSELSVLVSNYHRDYSKACFATPEQLLQLLEKTDAFRRPERYEKFLLACAANDIENQSSYLRLKKAQQAAVSISIQPLLAEGLTGKAIASAIKKLRTEAIRAELKID